MSKKKKIDSETREIIDSFVSEGYDLIEDVEGKIVNLDSVHDKEVINTIFRLFHSIKGTAGYLNLNNIKNVTHEAETLLDFFRKQDVVPNQETIDLLYQTLDFLRQLIMNVEKELTDEGFEEPADIIIHGIRECSKSLQKYLNKKNGSKKQDTTKNITVSKNNGKKSSKKDEFEIDENFITPEIIENFLAESNDILDKIEKSSLQLEKSPKDKDLISDIFRNIHTLKGNSGAFGFAWLEEYCQNTETFLDRLRKDAKGVGQNDITTILRKVDWIRQKIVELSETKNKKKKAKENEDINDYEFLEDKPLGEILVEMGEATEESVQKALQRQDKPIGEILIEMGETKKSVIEKALKIQNKAGDSQSTDFGFNRKDIRVDISKLDILFDMVGELIIASAMVINSPDLNGLKLENFKKSASSFTKITRDIQEVTMSMRMIPLDSLFIKMKRLVRDLSRKSNKDVLLKIYGQDTEMDRNVIELISDPLVHILRNSIDHGIEEKEKRKEENKDSVGNITLGAKYEGSEIWIMIEDDGRGLDRKKIIDTAIQKGIFKRDVDKITDDEVWKFIFEAGFSTVEQLSDISGRGVGMDVVRRNIEKIKGKIDIESTSGRGTKITLKIPLTLAIMDGITFKIGENLYSIPTTEIQEFFQASSDQITKTEDQREVAKLREEILPVIKLYELFKIETDKKGLNEGIMIVVHSNMKKACLFVDEIVGNHQIVVKSITEYLGNVKGISGCTIMGNGEVSLIIDTSGLMSNYIE